MNLENVLNLAQELRGMPVVEVDGRQRAGTVVDALVHPTEGVMLGLVVITDQQQEVWLRANDCFVYRSQGVVIVTPDAWEEAQQTQPLLTGGVRVCEKILGIQVVTQRGKSLGRVVEVYATEGELRTIYRVATPRLWLFVRQSLYLPGDLPLAWLEQGARLIVPADAMERESCSNLADALKFV